MISEAGSDVIKHNQNPAGNVGWNPWQNNWNNSFVGPRPRAKIFPIFSLFNMKNIIMGDGALNSPIHYLLIFDALVWGRMDCGSIDRIITLFNIAQPLLQYWYWDCSDIDNIVILRNLTFCSLIIACNNWSDNICAVIQYISSYIIAFINIIYFFLNEKNEILWVIIYVKEITQIIRKNIYIIIYNNQ